MAKGKNCPNCGAVIDKDVDKCAYGGAPWPPSTKLLNFTRSRNVNLDTNFEIVPDDKGNLITMVVEE